MNPLRTFILRALRWSERYTRTDMVYVTRGMSWMTAGQAVSAGSAFLLAIAFANLLPKETYGSYKYILSLAAIFGAFSLTGMGPILTKAIRQGYEGLLRKSVMANFAWSLPVSGVAFAMALYYIWNGNLVLGTSLGIVGLFTPVLNSAQLYIWFLNGKEDFRRSSMYGAMTSAIHSATLFIALALHTSVPVLIFAYFLSVTSANILCHYLTVRFYKPSDKTDPHSIRFGTRLSLVTIIGAVAGQMDKVVLFHFLGPVPVAIYALAQAPVVQMRALLKLTTPLAIPRLAAQDPMQMSKTLHEKSDRFTLAIAAMVIVYVIAAPLVYSVFFPLYVESVVYSQAYALLLLLYPKKLFAIGLMTQNRTRETYALSLISPIVQTAVIILFIPLIGIWGAIIAEVSASLAHYVLANYFFERFRRQMAAREAQ